jgi:peroxisomal 2,4-dienoyl-CoA reductase
MSVSATTDVAKITKSVGRRPKIFRHDVLSHRVSVITGGSSGIGLGIAEVFVELGSTVVLIGRKEDRLASAKKFLLEATPNATVLTSAVDVRDHDAIGAAIGGVADQFGHLDVLINNAAGNFHCPTEQLSPNGWRTVIDIDLNGTFNGCQAALPGLKASTNGGRIINITVPQALSGWPGSAHAAAAKAGVLSLPRRLAVFGG